MDAKEQENWNRSPADYGQPRLQVRSDVVPLHAFRTPEEAMTDYYLGIDVHKTDAQVAVLDDEGQVSEEIRVANANLDELAQKYTGNESALEAGSNYFAIIDTLEEYLDATLANPAQADWLVDQKQKNDRKDAKNLARYLRLGDVPESYVPPENFRKYRVQSEEIRRQAIKLQERDSLVA